MDILIPLYQYRKCLWFLTSAKNVLGNFQIIQPSDNWKYIKQDCLPLTAKLYDKRERIQIFCPKDEIALKLTLGCP